MNSGHPEYASVGNLLLTERPTQPVYCIFPHVIEEIAHEFLNGFPGRVLYAVKANSEPGLLRMLTDAGVKHFDCASLAEIELVLGINPDATAYFMTPVRLRGAARIAQENYGVRHFVIDHESGLAALTKEIDTSQSVIFARMAVEHKSALENLSLRFGAPPKDMVDLLTSIQSNGAEPALAFNVGSMVTDPDAYRYALSVTASVLEQLPFRLRLIDVGGGYPKSYPGFVVPGLQEYFNTVTESFASLPLSENAEVLGEPGRALSAPGMSAVVEVLLRKENRLFINDGMFGIFWLLRIDGPDGFPVRAYRNGQPHQGETMEFWMHGPTCDSTDTLPGAVTLPVDIQAGDYLEFGNIGAYSITGRTNYNGLYSDRIVSISSVTEKPPLLESIS